jgi:nucleoid DNA-binding protein
MSSAAHDLQHVLSHLQDDQVKALTVPQLDAILTAYTGIIVASARRGGRMKIAGLGTFTEKAVAPKPARPARNPQTGETITAPAKDGYRTLKFKADPKVNRPL